MKLAEQECKREVTKMALSDEYVGGVGEDDKDRKALREARQQAEIDEHEREVQKGMQTRAELSNSMFPVPKDFVDYCFDAGGPEVARWKYRTFYCHVKEFRNHTHCQYPMIWRKGHKDIVDILRHPSVKDAKLVKVFGIDHKYDGMGYRGKQTKIYAIDPKSSESVHATYGFIVFDITFEDNNTKTIHFFTEETIRRSDMDFFRDFEKETAHVALEKYIDRCKRLAIPGYNPELSYTKISKEDLSNV